MTNNGNIGPIFEFAIVLSTNFEHVIFVTLAYGPIAAFLVELFPTKIR